MIKNITNEQLNKMLELSLDEWVYDMISEMIINEKYKKEMIEEYWESTFIYLLNQIN